MTNAQDDCASALEITYGMHTVDEVNGTEIPSPICAANGDGADFGEWYTFTLDMDTVVTITTDLDQNSGGDTRFHLYVGECGNLTCVGGDDDGGNIGNGYLSIASIPVVSGIQYYLAFDDRWNDAGFDFLMTGGVIEAEGMFSDGFININGNALAVVDMNDDGLDDVVDVDGSTLYIHHQDEAGFLTSQTVNTSDPENNPSWSLAAGDIDGNGMTDLLYGGGSGVTFMIANEDGTEFTQFSGDEYVFCQRTNMIDINGDGNLDAFVCHDVDPNVYFLNDGNGNLTYFQGGLGDLEGGGNYGSVWIDFDNDNDMDLFLAKCRGGNSILSTDQLHVNQGNGVFVEMAADYNLNNMTQTWSSAWGDYDNDGDMDVFVGASSFSSGDHLFMRNDGDTFTDITASTGFGSVTSTGIENCTQDFNNDGYLDILGCGGNLYLNNGDMTFTDSDAPINNGPIGDLNGDGFLDVVNGNFIKVNNGNDNNYLRVHLQGVESNRDGIGARVEVTSALGTQIRDIRAGEGFRYMSSITAHFGIAEDTEVEQIVVHWPSGNMDVITDPSINTTVLIEEGSTSTGVSDFESNQVSIFPTPAENVLNVVHNGLINDPSITVIDITGKAIFQSVLEGNTVDISSLSAGQYILRLRLENRFIDKPFIKK
ncbi:MAG: T9SS type A sorting domain-containing protein [Flavobacteriales bacterium]|nr:T9SS type A sorting domain-containing protein [Flavobacteriales bacterium]